MSLMIGRGREGLELGIRLFVSLASRLWGRAQEKMAERGENKHRENAIRP